MNKNFYISLYNWYLANKRVLPWRETEDAYCIWVSEIILQQTRVEQGLPYYMRFIQRFPDVASLATASEDEVLLYWQGLGYYSRARNLHKGAQMIYGSHLNQDASFPTTYEQLRLIPGVGEYTAGAIASFAYNLPYPALDGNVYRVLARLYDCDIAFDTSAGKKYFHRLAEQLLDRENARLFNSAIMEFGALYCTPSSSDCEHCPLSTSCSAYSHHTVALLPIRKPRPKVKDRYLHYVICLWQGKTIIQQRKGNDIWKHLYEFPILEDSLLLDGQQLAKKMNWLNQIGVSITQRPMDYTHLLSHQRLHARFFIIECQSLPSLPDAVIVPFEQLSDYPFPRPIERVIEEVLSQQISTKKG